MKTAPILKLPGPNMDIDLTTPSDQIQWEQANCPWTQVDVGESHRCAIKNISICPYFCGISYLHLVLCSYPHQNPNRLDHEKDQSFLMQDPFKGGSKECEPILMNLPEWFGIETANEKYLWEIEVMDTFLASQESEVVGFLTLKIHNPEAAEVHILGVSPNLHRLGIGRAIVIAAEDCLQSSGYSFLQVKTLIGSHPDPNYAWTRLFYEAMGFKLLEEFRTWWVDANPCVQLIKSLALSLSHSLGNF